jgi:hypothetical protein
MLPDFLLLVVSRDDIESGNIRSTVEALKALNASPELAAHWRERVDIVFAGYDDTRWELFEIQQVRDFVYKLDEAFPFWLFFLSKAHLGLHCIMLCLMPPFLKPEAEAEIIPERLVDLLLEHWFPAMNRVCEMVGMSEQQIEQMTDRVVHYFETRLWGLAVSDDAGDCLASRPEGHTR